jgi:hypothetical protein
MPNEKIQGMIIKFSKATLFNLLRKETVRVNSFRSLEKVKVCLQSKTPVKICFERSDYNFKARMIPFIEGMSTYFGATAEVVGA